MSGRRWMLIATTFGCIKVILSRWLPPDVGLIIDADYRDGVLPFLDSTVRLAPATWKRGQDYREYGVKSGNA